MPQISAIIAIKLLENFLLSIFLLSLRLIYKNIKGGIKMLIIDSKDCENIDKALKKYKKKFEKSRTLLQLRGRQAFIKPSIVRRGQVLKAIYKQQLAAGKLD